MHREFESGDSPFQSRTQVSLYLMTGLLGALLAADLWPLLARWLTEQGIAAPTWTTRELSGYRFGLIAAVLGGIRVLYASLDKLAQGKISAVLAVAIACLAAILIGEPIVAAEVVFIGLVGECLEAYTFQRTQRALAGLAELFPHRCWVLRDGVEVRTFTRDLMPGLQVVIKPGGKIPADGVVLQGNSAVDESALTGESVPVDKTPGQRVLAGSVVLHGTLTILAEKVARQTVAGQLIELTTRALKDKSPGERYADRLARLFLPAVLTLAVLVLLLHLGLQYAGPVPEGRQFSFAAACRVALYPTLAVLVVACPCPLVLATPAAVIAALGRLAGTGVLVKSGAALERLAEVKSIAFDKTGTLTEGRLELGDIHLAPGIQAEELLRFAAAVEQHSEHPVALLMVEVCRERGIAIPPSTGFQAHPGLGVSARTNEEILRVGSLAFIQADLAEPADEISRWSQALETTGQSPLFVARNGRLLGALGTRDRLRDDALPVLTELRDLGLSPIRLLTGDRASVAQSLAGNLPITEVKAELLPAQKSDNLGEFTAFVGDGINDAPALAKAHVGIAIGTGTDLAAEAGDVVMMGDPLRPLPLLFRLSRETAAVIRQNIVWFGFGVNLLGVLLTGILWPIFAPSANWYEKAPLAGVLYHQLGSLLVLLNSMRLLAFDRAGVNSTLGQARTAVRNFDRWLNTLHLDDAFHWLGHHARPVLAGTLALVLALWLLSGLTTIEADEVGVLQRFGALRGDLSPGLHLRWPWPVETVIRVKPREPRQVEIGFRLPPFGPDTARQEQARLRGMLPDGQTWTSAHADGITRLTEESLMLTGDGDLIEILATVRYLPEDPRQFALGTRELDAMIRSVAESVLREQAAARPLQNLLASGRAEFEAAVQSSIVRRLGECAPGGLGIRIIGVSVHDMHPPPPVVRDYHAVAEAIQKRDRQVNDAQAESTRLRSRAAAEAQKLVRSAEADAQAKIAEAQASRDVFLDWVDKRRAQSATARTLTDLRLSLDAITNVLRTRDKILIDADKLPGTRKLYLLDPDLLPRSLPPIVKPNSD